MYKVDKEREKLSRIIQRLRAELTEGEQYRQLRFLENQVFTFELAINEATKYALANKAKTFEDLKETEGKKIYGEDDYQEFFVSLTDILWVLDHNWH